MLSTEPRFDRDLMIKRLDLTFPLLALPRCDFVQHVFPQPLVDDHFTSSLSVKTRMLPRLAADHITAPPPNTVQHNLTIYQLSGLAATAQLDRGTARLIPVLISEKLLATDSFKRIETFKNGSRRWST